MTVTLIVIANQKYFFNTCVWPSTICNTNREAQIKIIKKKIFETFHKANLVIEYSSFLAMTDYKTRHCI